MATLSDSGSTVPARLWGWAFVLAFGWVAVLVELLTEIGRALGLS